ncbi:MAG: helix-turn-helix domain-containing protein [Candidatus Rokuibacteriota bacterium]
MSIPAPEPQDQAQPSDTSALVPLHPTALAAQARELPVRVPARIRRPLEPMIRAEAALGRRLAQAPARYREEARKQLGERSAMREFEEQDAAARHACIWCGEPLGARQKAGFCKEEHRAKYARALERGNRLLADRLAELNERQGQRRWEIRGAKEDALVELGRAELDVRRRRMAEARRRRQAAIERDAQLVPVLESQVANPSGRKPEEVANLARMLEEARERLRRNRELLPRLAEEETAYARAWGKALLDEAERRRPVAGPGPWFCTVCQAPAPQGEGFCSRKCERRWRAVGVMDPEAWARRCWSCNKWFRSEARAVEILSESFLLRPKRTHADVEDVSELFSAARDNYRPPTLLSVAICTAECWQQAPAVAPEPPAFPPAEYPGPPPQLLPGGAGTGSGRPADVMDAVYQLLLAELPGGLTARQVADRLGAPASSVRGALAELARRGKAHGGGRGGQWRAVVRP